LAVPQSKAGAAAINRKNAPTRSPALVIQRAAHSSSVGRDGARSMAGIGNQATLRRMVAGRTQAGAPQYKLTIGAANDPLEQEADHVADQVMRMSDPDLAVTGSMPQVIRRCAACEDEEKAMLHRKADGSNDAEFEDASESVGNVLSSPGTPLDASAREYLEPRFGLDFSHIRVHTDERASESSRSVGALAYATGQHIVFAAGRYDPRSTPGRRLIAHELTHTIQQGGGRHRSRGESGARQSLTVSRRAAGLQRLIQRVGECAGKSYKDCSGSCIPAGGKGTGLCIWSGQLKTGCICYRRDQPMLRAIEQVLFDLVIAALIAAGIVLTAAGIAAIIACLAGPCEAAALVGAVGAAAAAIIMAIIGKKPGSAAGGPSAANSASAGGGATGASGTAPA
jgi:hypothetical protein